MRKVGWAFDGGKLVAFDGGAGGKLGAIEG